MQEALAQSFTATGIPAVGQLATIVGDLATRFADAADATGGAPIFRDGDGSGRVTSGPNA